MAECIRLLQIGDVHLPEWVEDKSSVDLKDPEFSKRIAEDLSQRRLRNVLNRIHEIASAGHVDCVAFMGDLTSWGLIEHIEPAVEIFDSLVRNLRGTAPKMMGVPGNHDVDKDEAARLGPSGKFARLDRIFRKFGWTPPPIDEAVALNVKSHATHIPIVLLNTSVGSWSKHILPKAIAESFETSSLEDEPLEAGDVADIDLQSSGTATLIDNPPKSRNEQLFLQMDTPYVSKRSMGSLHKAFRETESNSVVLIAHHNLLPQRIPRILPYGELLNGGAFRQFLHQTGKHIIYLHGHIHEDPIESISAPNGDFAERQTPQILSISAPELKDGFNEIALFHTKDGEVFMVRVTRYRPDSMNMVGNFSDQSSIYIPLITDFRDLTSAGVRLVAKAVEDHGTVNWQELRELVPERKQSDDDLESNLLKLFCCKAIKISNLGRSRTKWTIDRV